MPDPLAQAMRHPLRHRMLFEFQARAACPSDVARVIGAPLNLVSYHTRALARAGLLELVRTERRRGGLAHYYRATVTQHIDDEDWMRLSVGRRRGFALATLARVAAEARGGVPAGAFDRPRSHLVRVPFALDDQGVVAVSAALRRTFDDITAIGEAASRRAADQREYLVVILGFRLGGSASPSTTGDA